MAKKKSALGKGLGALLPSDPSDGDEKPELARTRLYNFEDRIKAAGRISDISVDRIDPNPLQPRTAFDDEDLEELAASIRQLGIIQPITVRSASEDRYQLISGERRLRAARKAGLEAVPAYVREADNEAMLEMAIVENVQRTSLNPIEIALGYQRLIDECGLRQEDVAEKVGKNRATVANFIRLLKLPAPVQVALRDGSLTTGHARALLSLESESDQIRLLKLTVRKELSVREVEERVNRMKAGDTPKSKKSGLKLVPPEDPGLRVVRDRIRNSLSTQVVIKPTKGKKGGRIEVEYYSDDDLERIAELITG